MCAHAMEESDRQIQIVMMISNQAHKRSHLAS